MNERQRQMTQKGRTRRHNCLAKERNQRRRLRYQRRRRASRGSWVVIVVWSLPVVASATLLRGVQITIGSESRGTSRGERAESQEDEEVVMAAKKVDGRKRRFGYGGFQAVDNVAGWASCPLAGPSTRHLGCLSRWASPAL